MKKTLVVGLALGFVLAAGSAMAGTIVGSAHDLSDGVGGTQEPLDVNAGNQARICVFCHTPHFSVKPTSQDAGSRLAYSPLWNKDLSTYTAAEWTLYDNGTPEAGTDSRHQLNADLDVPSSTSMLCLSCHDGSIALNAYGNQSEGSIPGYKASGTTDITDYAASKQVGLGGDLSNHHPVEFDYVAARANDPELAAVSTEFKDAAGLDNGITIQSVLVDGTYFTCGSCHDVHNTQADGPMFIWGDNTRSRFCLACHVK